MFVRLCLCALLVGVAGVASAQNQPAPTQPQPAARQLTPEQRAAIEKQNQELAKYAESLAQMIDNGQTGQVWDQASSVAKQSAPRDKFVTVTDAERAKLGKVASRKLARIYRAVSQGVNDPPGQKLPAGRYINVLFATTFSKHAEPMRELVSFHEDSDHKWRLSGYTIEQPAPATAARK